MKKLILLFLFLINLSVVQKNNKLFITSGTETFAQTCPEPAPTVVYDQRHCPYTYSCVSGQWVQVPKFSWCPCGNFIYQMLLETQPTGTFNGDNEDFSAGNGGGSSSEGPGGGESEGGGAEESSDVESYTTTGFDEATGDELSITLTTNAITGDVTSVITDLTTGVMTTTIINPDNDNFIKIIQDGDNTKTYLSNITTGDETVTEVTKDLDDHEVTISITTDKGGVSSTTSTTATYDEETGLIDISKTDASGNVTTSSISVNETDDGIFTVTTNGGVELNMTASELESYETILAGGGTSTTKTLIVNGVLTSGDITTISGNIGHIQTFYENGETAVPINDYYYFLATNNSPQTTIKSNLDVVEGIGYLLNTNGKVVADYFYDTETNTWKLQNQFDGTQPPPATDRIDDETMSQDAIDLDVANVTGTVPQQPRPTYANMKQHSLPNNLNTPGGGNCDWQCVASKIGGEVNNPLKGLSEKNQNTCATRVSRMLNYSNVTIPSTPYASLTGADGKNYITGAVTMLNFLKQTFGTSDPATTIHLSSTNGSITQDAILTALHGKQGIYAIIPIDASKITGFGASGHVDLLDSSGKFISGHSYTYCDGGVKEVYLFILP